MKYCFGVDIGGTTVKMGLFEENGDDRRQMGDYNRHVRGRKGYPSECCSLS